MRAVLIAVAWADIILSYVGPFILAALIGLFICCFRR